ncbi:diphthine--ammonia ligase [Candidatus Woesearchaeota archaeon]|nr:diphthine--ammonia ligase [Candidatus Woesearchaeota archaeon]
MCSILGICGINGTKDRAKKQEGLIKSQEQSAKKALSQIKYRGLDAQHILTKEGITFGHCLHAMIGFIPQPLKGKGMLTANCEIYNWKELGEKYGIAAKNDADLLFQLLEKNMPLSEILDEIDGTYAFAYARDGRITLARDILGIKPAWYSLGNGFSFASEKKALAAIGADDVFELNPRKILVYDSKAGRANFINRPFFTTTPEADAPKEKVEEKFEALLASAIQKRIPQQKFGLLFSGGLDSTILAAILKKMGAEFTCYLSVFDHPTLKQPEDIEFAQQAAKALKLRLKIIKTSLQHAENDLKKIVPLIEDTNATKAAIALTFFEACRQAKEDGCRALFSGLGADEICGGYERQRNSADINKECFSSLLKIYERDLYRDDVVGMANGIEMRMPFLDRSLVEYALKIPQDCKIGEHGSKLALRWLAKRLAIPEAIVGRKKRGAQYGSRFQTAVDLSAKKNGFTAVPEYLKNLTKTSNPALGALISTGKDSWYAAWRMAQQNYPIRCMITLESKNPDSFMFHTPAVSLAALQSKASGIPLITIRTEGNKEEELNDLKKAFDKAKRIYKIEGIVSGAIHSTYQRDRIETIADGCSLKIFTPLWHSGQASLVSEIIRLGFRAVLTAIAAEGFDGGWLGRRIDKKAVEELISLHKKFRISIAGEGGEYESLVLDCPLFRKQILLKEVVGSMDGRNTGKLKIVQAKLVKKD